MKFIVEHMEPELFDWCVLEYKHMSSIVGKDNLIFTNISKEDQKKLEQYGEVTEQKITEITIEKGCILDPYAEQTLTPEDKEKFKTFIFGGILGNNPAEKRTSKLTNALKLPTRNLGAKQLSTDTAVYVTKKILDGTSLENIRFVDEVEIEREEGESIILPFPYAVEDKKLIINQDLVEHVKKHGFE